MLILVGLGNPGIKYKNNRHNVGQLFIDFIAPLLHCSIVKKEKMFITMKQSNNETITLAKPQTFMNNSGVAVRKLIVNCKLKIENLIVIHDDVDLPLGKIKISFGRSSGGHKGVESIIKNIKTKDFARIRIGVSKAGVKGKVKKPQGDKFLDFIVGKFKPDELKEIKKASKKVTEALDTLIAEGLNKAMSLYN